MQQIFYTAASPEEYWRLGKDFAFPDPPAVCPFCRTGLPLKKHGFYRRNSIPGQLPRRILIRRYRCRFCGRTVSFLPGFCLPYFQYTLELIYQALQYRLHKLLSLRACLARFKELGWEPAHLRFYARRFLAGLARLKLVLRQMHPRVSLPAKGNLREEASYLLLILTGFGDIRSFSVHFYASCGWHFLAPFAN
jgi:hypothetical protein